MTDRADERSVEDDLSLTRHASERQALAVLEALLVTDDVTAQQRVVLVVLGGAHRLTVAARVETCVTTAASSHKRAHHLLHNHTTAIMYTYMYSYSRLIYNKSNLF